MNDDTKSIHLTVRVSLQEYFALLEIAEGQNINLAELFRACTLTDFAYRQTRIRVDDIFEFCSIMEKLGADVKTIIEAIKTNGQMYIRDINKIITLLADIKHEASYIYKNVEFNRNRVVNELARIISQQKLNPNCELISDNKSLMIKDLSVKVNPKQYEIIKAKAKEEECSISMLLKRNVFKKCGDKRIVVSYCSLDYINQQIEKTTRLLNVITKDISNRFIESNDIINILNLMQQVLDTEKQFKIGLKAEQKDIRKEARDIISERRNPQWQ